LSFFFFLLLSIHVSFSFFFRGQFISSWKRYGLQSVAQIENNLFFFNSRLDKNKILLMVPPSGQEDCKNSPPSSLLLLFSLRCVFSSSVNFGLSPRKPPREMASLPLSIAILGHRFLLGFLPPSTGWRCVHLFCPIPP